MKRNRIRRFLQQKQYAVVSFIFFVAIAGMTGVYLSNRITRENSDNQIAQKETDLFDMEDGSQDNIAALDESLTQQGPESILNKDDALPSEEDAASASSIINPSDTSTNTDTGTDTDADTQADTDTQPAADSSAEDAAAQEKEQKDTAEKQEKAVKKDTAAQAKAAVSNLHFSPETDLTWPMQGDVILNYSMDQTVYFATLEQYKYNPALIIAAKVNDSVKAAADGRITDISTNEETGVTVTMDLGDGYSAVYGQLKEVLYKEGAAVEAGNAIGYIAEPTKYYSVEGSNLYFQLLKDGEPVNPMQYME